MTASPLLAFLLRSLNHPSVDSFDVDDPCQFQAAVAWLENTRIRHYPVEGRQELQSKDPLQWQAALQKYLTDLESPTSYDGANQRAVLRWLLMYAVEREYTDAAQQLNAEAAAAEAEVGPPEDWSEPPPPPLPDITSDAVRSSLLRLQQLLHVGGGDGGAPGPEEATPEGLQRAHAMLEACVLPAIAAAARQQQQQQQQAGSSSEPAPTAAAPQHAAAAALLSRYPLGFSTGDGGADLAASILRMLYIKDLRELQTQVDSAVVQVQEFTANPRTDASLGKVGR